MRKNKDEAAFKKGVIDLWRKSNVFDYIFCIETEETEPGFPDVQVKLRDTEVYKFFEFKVSNEKGLIEFTRNQPSFYKLHPRMDIQVLAMDLRSPEGEFVMFPVRELFRKGGNFEMNEKREVMLP